MKMTMHIDEALLERVMERYDLESKTEAVEFALRELDRKHRLREFLKNGLGLKPEELAGAYDPNYDPDTCGLCVAEPPPAPTSARAKTRRKGVSRG